VLTPKECPTTRWIGQGWLIRIHLPEHLPSPSPFVLNSTPEFSSCQDVLSISLQFLPGQSMRSDTASALLLCLKIGHFRSLGSHRPSVCELLAPGHLSAQRLTGQTAALVWGGRHS
jgi:hypothetical protein